MLKAEKEYQVGDYVEYTPTKEVGIVKCLTNKPFAQQATGFYEWIPVTLKSGKHIEGTPITVIKCTKNWYESSGFIRKIKHFFNYKLYQ